MGALVVHPGWNARAVSVRLPLTGTGATYALETAVGPVPSSVYRTVAPAAAISETSCGAV